MQNLEERGHRTRLSTVQYCILAGLIAILSNETKTVPGITERPSSSCGKGDRDVSSSGDGVGTQQMLCCTCGGGQSGTRWPPGLGGRMAEMAYGETYRYLEVAQLFGANQARTKERIKKEFIARLRKCWSSQLNAHKKNKANNSWATAVLQYFFGTIRWSDRELVELDRKARRIMRQYKCHHANASVSDSTSRDLRVEGG